MTATRLLILIGVVCLAVPATVVGACAALGYEPPPDPPSAEVLALRRQVDDLTARLFLAEVQACPNLGTGPDVRRAGR